MIVYVCYVSNGKCINNTYLTVLNLNNKYKKAYNFPI